MKMIFLDTLIDNPDRHISNFGLLRYVETGGLLGLAPIYDHNMALISRGYPKYLEPENDFLIQLLNEFLETHPNAVRYIPEVTEETVRGVMEQLSVKVETQTLVQFVMWRYGKINKAS